MARPKYAIVPGYVTSRSDGDRHWIGARQLMRLYDVRPSECVIIRNDHDRLGLPDDIKYLHPRYDGQYRGR